MEQMTKEDLYRVWEEFIKGKDFKLNPDPKFVEYIANGVLKNEEKTGFKTCPCRISDGSYEGNLELICPCNFKTHDKWMKQGSCFCGLFVKR